MLTALAFVEVLDCRRDSPCLLVVSAPGRHKTAEARYEVRKAEWRWACCLRIWSGSSMAGSLVPCGAHRSPQTKLPEARARSSIDYHATCIIDSQRVSTVDHLLELTSTARLDKV